jgi:hypothetical protein
LSEGLRLSYEIRPEFRAYGEGTGALLERRAAFQAASPKKREQMLREHRDETTVSNEDFDLRAELDLLVEG